MTNDIFSKKGLFFITLLSFGASSCFKAPDFPTTPVIEYVGFQKIVRLDQTSAANKDSVTITLKFQDGDGDLGYSSAERDIAAKAQNYNYVVKAFRKKNGRITEFTPLESLSGYFPRLKLDDKIGPIEGTLDYSIDFLHPFTFKRDSLQFQIFIKDRAGNISNTIETEMIVVNNI